MDSNKHTRLVIDYGATNHTTFDLSVLQVPNKPHCSHVRNANGVSSQLLVLDCLTLSLSLKYKLFFPSLSNNLLPPSQVTQQLNCLVLMYPHFCILQDLNNNEIGHETKRWGLYYVDDLCRGIDLIIHGSFSTK